MRRLRVGAAVLLLAPLAACGPGEDGPAPAEAPELSVLFRVDSLDGPESVAWDEARRRWLITNQAGGEAGSGAGFLSAVSADGDSVVRVAFGGRDGPVRLDSPTGIAVRGDRAFVVDRERVVAIDLTGGSDGWSLELPDAGFPNDVALAEDGHLYVSDTGRDAIWRIPADGTGRERLVPTTVSLRSPNGLLVDPGEDSLPGGVLLLVAGWEGTVMALNADSSVTLLAESAELERLDGIQRAPDGGLLVTDYARGRLQHLEPGERRVSRAGVPWLTDLARPADFLVRDTILALPENGADRVTFYRLPDG